MDKTIIRPEPYGVVLIIGSWNYPLHISLAPLAGAISAGNCAVIKPSEISPHTAEAIEKLLPRYIDQDCFKYVFKGKLKEGSSRISLVGLSKFQGGDWRCSRDDRFVEGTIRLHLLHGIHGRRKNHSRSGKQIFDSLHFGARGQKSRFYRRSMQYWCGGQEDHLGKNGQPGPDVYCPRLHPLLKVHARKVCTKNPRNRRGMVWLGAQKFAGFVPDRHWKAFRSPGQIDV